MIRPQKAGMATAEGTLAGKAVSAAAEEMRPSAAGAPAGAEWFTALVERHLGRVLTLLNRIVGNYADAQDIAQEVFLKAYQRQHQLRDPERVRAWLMRIASNAAIDFLRARGAEGTCRTLNEQVDTGPPVPSPEQQYVRDERQRRLHDALRLLAPKERAAIVLRDLEGLSGPEVAKALGCSPVTVRTHIASARIKLRRFFEGKEIRGAGK